MDGTGVLVDTPRRSRGARSKRVRHAAGHGDGGDNDDNDDDDDDDDDDMPFPAGTRPAAHPRKSRLSFGWVGGSDGSKGRRDRRPSNPEEPVTRTPALLTAKVVFACVEAGAPAPYHAGCACLAAPTPWDCVRVGPRWVGGQAHTTQDGCPTLALLCAGAPLHRTAVPAGRARATCDVLTVC